MDTEITERMRTAMLLSSVVGMAPDRLREGLALATDSRFSAPSAVGNAVSALRRHRHPASVLEKAQYRAAVPYVAAALAEASLARTIEVLGDAADDPTRDQLLEALDLVGKEFPQDEVAVMLASVAAADMEASDLCFDILATDDRFGLTDVATAYPGVESGTDPGASADADHRPGGAAGPSPEQRAARRLKKQRDAEERRKKAEAARRGAELARMARKRERPAAVSSGPDDPGDPDAGP